jgi:hypothetical protein
MTNYNMAIEESSIFTTAAIKFYWGGYVIPFIAGVLAVALGFAIAWPKTQKEGISRIFATILTSILAGESFVAYVYANPMFEFLPHNHRTEILLTVLAGLPAWWIGGLIIKRFKEGQEP